MGNSMLKLVEKEGKYNFVNQYGDYVSKKWFDDVRDFDWFSESVKFNNYTGKFNVIKDEINAKYAMVKLNGDNPWEGKWNFLNKDGKLLSHTWYDYVFPFCNGFAQVILDGQHNFIDYHGEILSNNWFDYSWPFNEDGYAKVMKNDEKKYITKYGDIIEYRSEIL